VRARGTRLLVQVLDVTKLDRAALKGAGVQAVVVPDGADRLVHLITGSATPALAAGLHAEG
jgi:PTS system N-acetylglucosamine-specific IIC component